MGAHRVRLAGEESGEARPGYTCWGSQGAPGPWALWSGPPSLGPICHTGRGVLISFLPGQPPHAPPALRPLRREATYFCRVRLRL